ncbi:tyrosinase-like protein [Mytilus galloprovincialis]|uniref:tyrosinase-like protein n=1 Tax=Mytilus galloprovincialis TaxID=29158 RepID=UPI003F7B8E0F
MRFYFLLMVFIPASALIVEDVFPPMLEECYAGQVDKTTTPYDVQTSCLESFLTHINRNTSSIGLGRDAYDWLDSLGKKLHIRLRRQARRGYYRLRVRKEIRALSEDERDNFFDAVNALKRDTSVAPNKYDSFVIMHMGGAGASAHGGPNFVSWHRYFCVLFENALRGVNRKSRSVTLPYWDSRADYLMTNRQDSILFTDIFIGNPKGIVYSGPFAFWSTPTKPATLLRRDVDTVGWPIDPQTIKDVFKKRYHREILTPTAPDGDYANLESHHDMVHGYVGGNNGHMADVNLSPSDPVFWLHHCFVDYLWEQFRKRQTKLGINSETDYPVAPNTEPTHLPNRIMDNLIPTKTNIQGFSNSFTKQIYRYADAPTCENRCGGAYDGFLFCDKTKNACVSRSRYDFVRVNGFRKVKNWYPPIQKGKRVPITTIIKNMKPTKQPTKTEMKNALGADADILTETKSGKESFSAFSRKENTKLTQTSAAPKITKRFKMPFAKPRRRRSVKYTLNGDNLNIGLDINLRLMHELRNSSSVSRTSYKFDNLALSPIAIINKHKRNQTPGNEEIKNQRTFNITFQTDGFSYSGRHMDYISIDERTLTSESVGFIAFEKPLDGETKAYVRAYDSNGEMCRTSCLVSQSMYKECSGLIKITSEYPRMFVDSYNGAFAPEITPFLRFDCVN